jgi:aldehyde dehydrogenase (NAD+)
MTITEEEIFGPVLSVITYEDEEDAIRIANDTGHGLHPYLSGTYIRRDRRVASQSQAGRLAISGLQTTNRHRSAGLTLGRRS